MAGGFRALDVHVAAIVGSRRGEKRRGASRGVLLACCLTSVVLGHTQTFGSS